MSMLMIWSGFVSMLCPAHLCPPFYTITTHYRIIRPRTGAKGLYDAQKGLWFPWCLHSDRASYVAKKSSSSSSCGSPGFGLGNACIMPFTCNGQHGNSRQPWSMVFKAKAKMVWNEQLSTSHVLMFCLFWKRVWMGNHFRSSASLSLIVLDEQCWLPDGNVKVTWWLLNFVHSEIMPCLFHQNDKGPPAA